MLINMHAFFSNQGLQFFKTKLSFLTAICFLTEDNITAVRCLAVTYLLTYSMEQSPS